MEQEENQEVYGNVERVVFHNEDNGWTVLELETDEELLKVVGVFPPVHVGESVHLHGQFAEHAEFGRQFRAVQCETHLPVGDTAILRYLSSGAVKGIGPATAIHIVKKFGDQTLEIMEQEPLRLAEIKGITPTKARKIGEDFASQFGLREVMLTFAPFGITPNEALRCWKRWGSATIAKIKENPYLLCATDLYVPFERADQIGMTLSGDAENPRRIEAGLVFVLRHNLGNGHTCLPVDKLIPTSAQMLQVSLEQVETALESLLSTYALRRVLMEERPYIFLPHLYQAERYAAARMQLMTAFPAPPGAFLQESIDAIETKNHIRYETQQRLAISQAIEKGMLILTGGPGTGKTTTLKAIITLLEKQGDVVAIAAPTGRAAKRIAELTGCEAKTIHRLLEVQWGEEDTPLFARDEKNPLDIDALVVDEMSMVDVLLFESLLRALKPRCRLIIVGDTDQLPAVGAGCVLQDLIDSGILPIVQLTQVFRQALESHIITGAHQIVRGEVPPLNYKTGDFFFLAQNTWQGVTQTVLDLCHRRLPHTYGYTAFHGIQVLCPGRKGELGTGEMNRQLQALLNPPAKSKTELTIAAGLLRVGDKVMHTRNNYDIGWVRDNGETGTGIYNGDIGMLEEVNVRAQSVSVRYEERLAVYTKEEAQDLELAYAVTVHKSQGSEFEAVILPLFRPQRQLCYRHLLYTAVTRARSLLIIVGSRDAVAQMVENNRKTLRYSGLRYFLTQTDEDSTAL